MYPQRELDQLAARKDVLRGKIAQRRVQLIQDAARVAKPLQWLDKMAALWQRIPSVAKLMVVPLGAYAIKRTCSGRTKFISSLLRWAPLAYAVGRSAASKPRS